MFAVRPSEKYKLRTLDVGRKHQFNLTKVTTYCKSRIFRMLFVFVYFVRGGFRMKISCVRMRCNCFIRIEGQRLYENFMRTKGRRSSIRKCCGYENLVHTKYSGFTIRQIQRKSTFRMRLVSPLVGDILVAQASFPVETKANLLGRYHL